MNSLYLNTWPYEQRFECCVRGSLLAIPTTLWTTTVEKMGCVIQSVGKTPSCHYYILQSGLLVVFERRCVLISCVPCGIADVARELITALEEKSPTHATLTRRYPVGEDLLSLAVSELDESQLPPVVAALEAGTIHQWPLEATDVPAVPQTLTLLLHGLVDSTDLHTVKAAISGLFPEFLIVGQSAAPDCFTVAGISGDQYISIKRTGAVYASVELSLQNWMRAEELINRALLLFKPEVVAPIWHGEPLSSDLGAISNTDTLQAGL
jgi:hypothetical protein